jgi:acyl-CoA thioesterase YciA
MSQSTTDDLTEVQEGPVGEPAIRTITMPLDTNPEGDIFGGWLMSQMDLAAGNMAAHTPAVGA